MFKRTLFRRKAVRVLHKLGIPRADIARSLSVTQFTIDLDIRNLLRRKLITAHRRQIYTRSTKEKIYTAAMRTFARLVRRMTEKAESSRMRTSESVLSAALRSWLGIDRMEAQIACARTMVNRLIQPTYATDYRPLLDPLRDIYGKRWSASVQNSVFARTNITEFFKKVAARQIAPPANRRKLFQSVHDWMIKDYRQFVAPVWGSGAAACVQEAIDALPRREAIIIHTVYGIGVKQMSLPALSKIVALSYERTRQLYQRGLRLIEQHIADRHKELLVPVGMLAELETQTEEAICRSVHHSKSDTDHHICRTLLPKLLMPIEDMNISTRLYNALKSRDAAYAGDVARFTKDQLLRTRNLGPKTLREARVVLQRMGLDINMNLPDDVWQWYREARATPWKYRIEHSDDSSDHHRLCRSGVREP